MAKAKATAFFCSECGCETSKWQGQCPSCKAWNTLVEAPRAAKKERITGRGLRPEAVPVTLSQIENMQEERFTSGFSELDGVLGGGIVPASLVLVGGDPGIGKSTLLLQMCRHVSAAGRKVLYISGEESLRQIKMRAQRMGEFTENLSFLCETDLDTVAETLRKYSPEVVIIDSIQTMYREDLDSAPGSVGQVRESTNVLLQLAKGLGITIFLVGHVTKEGTVAGPRMLEHMVDTVLYFEGERSASYRIIRAVKNRFGSTNEIGVFDMQGDGLHEVKNPSEFMLNGRPEGASGSMVTCAMEGTRPVLLEIQALVCRSNFGNPRRTAAGADYNRVNLLMAVLEKRMGLRLAECDAYVNIAGGMRLSEPSLDLGIVTALYSSYQDVVVGDKTMVFGEVGLAGEVRGVSQADRRVNEALKLGFDTCILPASAARRLGEVPGIRLIGVRNIGEALAALRRENENR
ncbi:MAG: DNA repair protein RadA [Lachnospiraceae bacterium]|nr:DNA repair protein RadA [Lachnospiraceae bacterium]